MEQKPDYFENSKKFLLLHARVTFKEIKETDDALTVRVVQKAIPPNTRFTKKQLGEIVHEIYKLKELFSKKIHVHAVPYIPYPFDHVDSKWIRLQMNNMKIGLKVMAAETGINKADISDIINERVSLDEITKPMFHYYFLSKKS